MAKLPRASYLEHAHAARRREARQADPNAVRPGPKPLPPQLKRSERFTVLCEPDLADEIRATALAQGLGSGEWLYHLALYGIVHRLNFARNMKRD